MAGGSEEGEDPGPGLAQLVRHVGYGDLLVTLGLGGPAQTLPSPHHPQTPGGAARVTPVVALRLPVRKHHGGQTEGTVGTLVKHYTEKGGKDFVKRNLMENVSQVS